MYQTRFPGDQPISVKQEGGSLIVETAVESAEVKALKKDLAGAAQSAIAIKEQLLHLHQEATELREEITQLRQSVGELALHQSNLRKPQPTNGHTSVENTDPSIAPLPTRSREKGDSEIQKPEVELLKKETVSEVKTIYKIDEPLAELLDNCKTAKKAIMIVLDAGYQINKGSHRSAGSHLASLLEPFGFTAGAVSQALKNLISDGLVLIEKPTPTAKIINNIRLNPNNSPQVLKTIDKQVQAEDDVRSKSSPFKTRERESAPSPQAIMVILYIGDRGEVVTKRLARDVAGQYNTSTNLTAAAIGKLISNEYITKVNSGTENKFALTARGSTFYKALKDQGDKVDSFLDSGQIPQ